MSEETKEFDVIVIGSYTCDLVSFAPRYPKPGESVRGTGFMTSPGGKGANQAAQCAKLGGKVAMVCKLGDDFFGHEALKTFQENGINTDMVTFTNKSHTGISSITVCESGEGHTVFTFGANFELGVEDVKKAAKHLKRSKILLCQFGIPKNANLFALRLARTYNLITILNAAPIVSDFDTEFLTLSDIVCVNKEEAEYISNMQISQSTDSHVTVLNYFHSFGIHTVLITLGDKGCLFSSLPEKIPTMVDSVKTTVVDTTGASDSFIGSFAYYLSNYPDLPLDEIVRRSCAIAAKCVEKPGAQTSYSTKRELPDDLFC